MQNLALENLEGCIVSPLNQMVSVLPISKNDIEQIIEESADPGHEHMLYAKTKDGRYLYAQTWPNKRGHVFIGSSETEVIQWGFTQKARDKWRLMF